MATHDPKLQQKTDACVPQVQCPQPQAEDCNAEVQLTGKLMHMECCCPRLYTRTYIIDIGPQTEPQLQAYLANTVASWENAGYLILGHSLVDTGAGWKLGLTVGWYA